MSDTPRTDKAVYLTKGPNFNAVCPNFARELERENAALRVLVKELERKLAVEAEYAAETHARHQGLVEQIAKLNSENATLSEDVVKANGLLDMQMKELAKLREDSKIVDELCTLHGCGREFLMVWCRAAAYAQEEYTRKEAQP